MKKKSDFMLIMWFLEIVNGVFATLLQSRCYQLIHSIFCKCK